MRRVKVDLEDRSYEILIGENLAGSIEDFFSGSKFSKRSLVIVDSNTRRFFKPRDGFECYEIPAGETSKSLKIAEEIYTRAIELKLDRKSPIIALGGGVVGDLSGFIASTYLRGVPFIQIPTTLLAQVDSSVGGKVAVNHRLGKNLIGSFYQPQAVFIDLNYLKTLPDREIRAGFSEIIKYGIIYDSKFFDLLDENSDRLLNLDSELMEKVIARSCEIKAKVVSKDERESDLRRILNFGHTIAHAVEEETRYEKFVHGEAVAIGMIAAARISKDLNLIDQSTADRIEKLIRDFQLPASTENSCDPDKIYNALFRDKKTIGGKINWVLVNQKIGNVFIDNEVPESVVRSAIESII